MTGLIDSVALVLAANAAWDIALYAATGAAVTAAVWAGRAVVTRAQDRRRERADAGLLARRLATPARPEHIQQEIHRLAAAYNLPCPRTPNDTDGGTR